LTSDIAPELRSLFAQDALQTAQMLLEAICNEADVAAEDLARDNRTLGELLGRAAPAVNAADGDLARETEAVLAEPEETSLSVGALSARNQRLRGLLERLLVICEDAEGGPAGAALADVRAEAYRHLRDVAARGWSFWDVFSFRERMVRLRAGGG
jgi:hypothetical protein